MKPKSRLEWAAEDSVGKVFSLAHVIDRPELCRSIHPAEGERCHKRRGHVGRGDAIHEKSVGDGSFYEWVHSFEGA